jgi:octaheme c-type cytochrome (tetrathionate reductase family)
MRIYKLIAAGTVTVVIIAIAVLVVRARASAGVQEEYVPRVRDHVDHSAFFAEKFESPQEVTRACLKCHEKAGEEMIHSVHWTWEGEPVDVPGHADKARLGKKTVMNNFCITIDGNWPSCTVCHAGYGWKDASFDFKKEENVDCLACHEHTGDYRKGKAGIPEPGVDLLASAKSVGTPKRENCGSCHFYGGGGLGVKHGDLDNSLEHASAETDVHMGKLDMLCVDCHKTTAHNIKGVAYSVQVDHDNGIGCVDCHKDTPHKDPRINSHLSAVACQTCHIPTFANRVPTKMDWDWSKAGDGTRPDDVHRYLKIKGEFIYDESVVPQYAWFNLTVDRYLVGDKMDPNETTALNPPRGNIHDRTAKIWPFKVHTAKQPYDKVNNYLLPPNTAGEGGFWTEFDWPKALATGAKTANLDFSGEYGFAATTMYWPLSHMVVPKDRALGCADCHGEHGRLDWNALGYSGDPIQTGGRR